MFTKLPKDTAPQRFLFVIMSIDRPTYSPVFSNMLAEQRFHENGPLGTTFLHFENSP
ncbi:hypothetical protein J2W56_005661 [Nocardia kruczakiae]|uniref:Uncharacterized protein n=1 Tax=Nocardia kruczakiae TaxID=261477 RepID=A0ABU1XMW8_9NOCA|nr:hypothetical protein [Nocardia kruczakiae]MDR7171900.1 hypothetical protein [Nocardia kruczakiae]